MDSLRISPDLEVFIVAGRVAAHDGTNGYRRAKAAFESGALGYREQAFLARWLELCGDQTERLPAPRTYDSGGKL